MPPLQQYPYITHGAYVKGVPRWLVKMAVLAWLALLEWHGGPVEALCFYIHLVAFVPVIKYVSSQEAMS